MIPTYYILEGTVCEGYANYNSRNWIIVEVLWRVEITGLIVIYGTNFHVSVIKWEYTVIV